MIAVVQQTPQALGEQIRQSIMARLQSILASQTRDREKEEDDF